MLRKIWEGLRRRFQRSAKPGNVPVMVEHQGTEMMVIGRMVIVTHRVGGHAFVWRYRVQYTREAMRSPGVLAAIGGDFTWQDAQAVTQVMRIARSITEGKKSANGV